MSKLKAIIIGVASSVLLFFLFGIPTAVVKNPFFTRMTSVSLFDWLILVLTSMLAGMYIGVYYWKKQDSAKATCAATGGSFLGTLSYGCAVCNKILVAILGFTGVMTYFMPVQPYLGVLSVVLLGFGIWSLSRG